VVHTISPAVDLSATARPEFAGLDDHALQRACKEWPIDAVPARDFDAFVSDVPTLIVEGGLAFFTTPQYVARIRSGLEHSSALYFRSLGNDILSAGVPSCLDDLRRRFLDNPSAHLATAACAGQSPKIDFVADQP
jgi:hypothetical protein